MVSAEASAKNSADFCIVKSEAMICLLDTLLFSWGSNWFNHRMSELAVHVAAILGLKEAAPDSTALFKFILHFSILSIQTLGNPKLLKGREDFLETLEMETSIVRAHSK